MKEITESIARAKYEEYLYQIEEKTDTFSFVRISK